MTVTAAQIENRLVRYANRRVAVLYSAGFDSSVLAHHLLHAVRAERVALILTDPGRENDYRDPWADRSLPEDHVEDVWQFQRYAHHLQMERDPTRPPYEIWPVRVPHLRSLIVKPENQQPPDNPSAARDEAAHGLVFYAGFVMQRLAAALSMAAAHGYDYVLTGHMAWNEHYLDESGNFAVDMTSLFNGYYGSRLRKSPVVQMPFRDLKLTKPDLIRWNEMSPHRLSPRWTISCNVCELVRSGGVIADFAVTEDNLQIHCGHCQHCLDRKASFVAAGVADTAEFAQ